MSERRIALDDESLVDLLDRLLDTGVVLEGSVLITLADVDLIRLDLRALLASVQTLSAPGRTAVQPQAGTTCATGSRPAPVEAVRPPRGDVRTPPAPPRTAPAEATAVREPTVTGTSVPGADGCPQDSTRPQNNARSRDEQRSGVAGLVVVLVDILRQLLERQAIRRMDAGDLDAVSIERLGQALMALERQVEDLAEALGLRSTHPSDVLSTDVPGTATHAGT